MAFEGKGLGIPRKVARMYCVECGTKNPDDARYCKQCGRRMEPAEPRAAESAEAAAPPAPPAHALPDPEARYKELLALAFRHYDHAEYDAATLAIVGALDLRPDSTDAHALLSTVYERQGERDKAIAEREKVLALNPASIADREKLEALRSGIAQVAPRRIMSSRRPEPTFWDTPGGAAAAAGMVTLIVVVVGYAVTLYRDRAARPAPQIRPGSLAQWSPPGWNRPAAGPAMASAGPISSGQPQTPGTARGPAANQLPQAPGAGSSPSAMVEPLPVRPTSPPLAQDARPPDAGVRDGSFFEPGRDGRPDPATAPPVGSGQSPPPNTGRIEIVVSPQGGAATTPPTNPNPGGANMESRNHAALAYDLQLKGDYKRAAAAWERALEGAGDDAPGLHLKAALCYQGMRDAGGARRHYTEAINGYRSQIASGRNVEAATQAIRSCEAGLAAIR
jgi:Tfp pilus assembly protein PilF